MKNVKDKLKGLAALILDFIPFVILIAVVILGAIIINKYANHPGAELPAWLHWIIRR